MKNQVTDCTHNNYLGSSSTESKDYISLLQIELETLNKEIKNKDDKISSLENSLKKINY